MPVKALTIEMFLFGYKRVKVVVGLIGIMSVLGSGLRRRGGGKCLKFAAAARIVCAVYQPTAM